MIKTVKNESTSNTEKLEQAFKNRKEAYTNRASCIFPFYIGEYNDTHLVFLNYWSLKNNISARSIVINIRLRSSNGELIARYKLDDLLSHNQISVKSILVSIEPNIDLPIEGTVELEVISIENLRYSFPAITAFYQSRNLFSAVHSAGRSKNQEESFSIKYSEETDWNCKYIKNFITPFFHFFVGPSKPLSKEIVVCLRDKFGEKVKEASIDISQMKEFASKTFYLDEIFDLDSEPDDFFCSVKLEQNSIYPRMVVGNFFKDKAFYETTHSFQNIENSDYCPVDRSASYQSIISAFSSEIIGLNLKTFPTFCLPNMDVDIYKSDSRDSQLILDDKSIVHNYSEFKYLLDKKHPPSSNSFIAYCLKGGKVPARITISYLFYLRGLNTNFSTDISDGAKANLFPPKKTLWGHGILGGGFDSCIFLRNIDHSIEETKTGKGKLRIFSSSYEYTFDIEAYSLQCQAITLSSLFKAEAIAIPKERHFFSWMLNIDETSCDIYWLSYDTSSGNILGDHAY